MRLGIFAKTFAGTRPNTVLAAARGAGFAAVQYNLACSGLDPAPERVPDDVARDVAAAASAQGVAIAALSGTVNLIHPDPVHRTELLRRLAEVIRVAPLAGAPMVTLCTGSRDAHDQWRHHPDNQSPDAWADLCRSLGTACDRAESQGLHLGIEPELGNVIQSAERARRLIDDLQSPALRIVLDPANLFETASDPADIAARAIDLLADRIVMAHAKDRDATGAFVAAGRGVIDFGRFIRDLHRAGFDGDLVTHGLTAAEAPDVAVFLSALT